MNLDHFSFLSSFFIYIPNKFSKPAIDHTNCSTIFIFGTNFLEFRFSTISEHFLILSVFSYKSFVNFLNPFEVAPIYQKLFFSVQMVFALQNIAKILCFLKFEIFGEFRVVLDISVFLFYS